MSAPAAPHPVLSADAVAFIYAHAQRDYPNECCGIVFGRRDQTIADHATACENIQDRLHAADPAQFMRSARTAYNLDKRDIVLLQESMHGDTPARIVYHSHINVGAYFSETDQTLATLNGQPAYPLEYVVIDIRAGGPSGAKQFAWNPDEGRFVEVGTYA
jgi:proteasome lid subunit RPN8/RPN11